MSSDPTPMPSIAGAPSPARVMDDPEPPTHAMTFRRLAEKADGLRDQALCLVESAAGLLDVVPENQVGSARVLCPLRTSSKFSATQRPAFDLPLTPPQPQKTFDARARYDALFWSESSVEKFVLPYYYRIRKPEQVLQLEQAFRDHADVYALGHVAPSDPSLLSANDPVRLLTPNIPPRLSPNVDLSLDEFLAAFGS